MSFSSLIFNIIFLCDLFSAELQASCPVNKETSCRTSPETNLEMNLQTGLVQELARNGELYQKGALQDNFFKELQRDSLNKVEKLQKNPAFQEIVKGLQGNSSIRKNTAVNSTPETQGNLREASLNEASLYIFVSFSLGEKALLNLAHDAKQFGATLVLRGFREGSYAKTVKALTQIILKTGQGVLIDPELYSLFNITAVPTFILAKSFTLNPTERTQTPIHDKLQGHVSARYVLESFAKEGDLKDEARDLLNRGGIK